MNVIQHNIILISDVRINSAVSFLHDGEYSMWQIVPRKHILISPNLYKYFQMTFLLNVLSGILGYYQKLPRKSLIKLAGLVAFASYAHLAIYFYRTFSSILLSLFVFFNSSLA